MHSHILLLLLTLSHPVSPTLSDSLFLLLLPLPLPSLTHSLVHLPFVPCVSLPLTLSEPTLHVSHPPSLSLSSMLVAVCPHHLLRCRSWLSPGKAPRALHALQRRPQPRPVRRRSSRTNDVTRGSAGNGCASQREHGVSSADLPGARFVAQHANVAVVHPQHVLHLVRDLK